jgi:hypothetical protein
MRCFVRSALVLSALALWSPSAGAYCRTTTSPTRANYDPTTQGCIADGTPLWWPQMPAGYQLSSAASKQIPLDQAAPIFERSFALWPAAECSPGVHPALSIRDLGATNATLPSCADGGCDSTDDQPNLIVFRDDAWPYNDSTNTLALTTVTYGTVTGHILRAVMEINSFQHHLSTAPNPADGAISLDAIATHEAGHFFGLAHSADQEAVMYAHYNPASLALTADDVAGICAVYPPLTPSGGCAAGAGAAGSASALAMVAIASVIRSARRRAAARRACPGAPTAAWPTER